MEFNKQLCASILGITMVVAHIALLWYLWTVFGNIATENKSVYVAEIATPLTGAFALTVVKWVIDTQGKITSEKTVGLTLVVILVLLTSALYGALIYGPYMYQQGAWQPDELNRFFVFVETGIGGMFGLLFNDMFNHDPDKPGG